MLSELGPGHAAVQAVPQVVASAATDEPIMGIRRRQTGLSCEPSRWVNSCCSMLLPCWLVSFCQQLSYVAPWAGKGLLLLPILKQLPFRISLGLRVLGTAHKLSAHPKVQQRSQYVDIQASCPIVVAVRQGKCKTIETQE